MTVDALIFDLDGTLLDSNHLHVRAWERAFAAEGFPIGADRIATEIGKGGDLLVPSVLGRAADAAVGDRLREGEKNEYARLVAEEGIALFDGAEALVREASRRGLGTALATSSNVEQLDAAFAAAGTDVRELMDAVVTSDDADASKPEPDVVLAAAAKLGLSPAQCAMIGDTTYDGQACRDAGVVFLGLLCGGTGGLALRAGGARGVWRDPAHLLAELDEALRLASPRRARLDHAALERLMREAIAAAQQGLEAGEAPIGAVVARGDLTIVGRGWNRLVATGSPIAHAEIVALTDAAGRVPAGATDLIVVSTLEPCVMCTGAAMESAIDTIVYGLPAPPDAGTARVEPPRSSGTGVPRIVGRVLEAECRALLDEWRESGAGTPMQRDYVAQLLDHAVTSARASL